MKTGWQEDRGQLANATDRSSEVVAENRLLDFTESIGDLEKDISVTG